MRARDIFTACLYLNFNKRTRNLSKLIAVNVVIETPQRVIPVALRKTTIACEEQLAYRIRVLPTDAVQPLPYSSRIRKMGGNDVTNVEVFFGLHLQIAVESLSLSCFQNTAQ